MTNISNNALSTLLKLAAEALDEAADVMVKSKKTLVEAQDKGNMLRDYREDYHKNLMTLLEKGLGIEAHINYQNFLKKLDEAIAGQEELIIAAQYQYKTDKLSWQEAQRKKMSYEVLLKRAKKAEHIHALKKEQKTMDDFASRVKRLRQA